MYAIKCFVLFVIVQAENTNHELFHYQPRVIHNEVSSAIHFWLSNILPANQTHHVEMKPTDESSQKLVNCSTFHSSLIDLRILGGHEFEHTFEGIRIPVQVNLTFNVTLDCTDQAEDFNFTLCTTCQTPVDFVLFRKFEKKSLEVFVLDEKQPSMCSVNETSGLRTAAHKRTKSTYHICTDLDPHRRRLTKLLFKPENVTEIVDDPLRYVERIIQESDVSVIQKAIRLFYAFRYNSREISKLIFD